ncbi:hypothetical protein D3C87_1791230 [compost metagenome]
MMTASAATVSVMMPASPLPSIDPPPPASVSMTATPAKARVLAISVERPAFSPITRKATPAVTKGTVA